jgi:hypothetical protein
LKEKKTWKENLKGWINTVDTYLLINSYSINAILYISNQRLYTRKKHQMTINNKFVWVERWQSAGTLVSYRHKRIERMSSKTTVHQSHLLRARHLLSIWTQVGNKKCEEIIVCCECFRVKKSFIDL